MPSLWLGLTDQRGTRSDFRAGQDLRYGGCGRWVPATKRRMGNQSGLSSS
jgi:hypothetical protein